MSAVLPGQIGLFEGLPQPGEYVSQHGRQLAFDELEDRVGGLIAYDSSSGSTHHSLRIVRVVKIYHYEDGRRRLIYDDGTRQHGLVDEMYFSGEYHGLYPSAAYELEINEGGR